MNRRWPIDWLKAFNLSLFLFLGLAPSVAQPIDRDLSSLKFEPLRMQELGPTGEVSDIIQGPKGFIWLGTLEGILRFDGYEFRTYANEKGNPNSLVSSAVLAFQVDEGGRVWIGTQHGVSQYIPETDSFRNYLLDPGDLNSNLANRVNAIVRDSRGRLFASSEAGFIYQYVEEEDRFVAINEGGLGIIKSMACDDQDRLWLGADSRLHRLDPESGELVIYWEQFVPDDPSSVNFIESVCFVDEENIWVGTAMDGAVKLNSLTGETWIAPQVLDGESYAHMIKKDVEGNIWIGHSSGLTLYFKGTGEVRRYHPQMPDGALPTSAIHSLLIDKQGNIWAGSAYHGLFVSTNNKLFHELDHYAGRLGSDKAVISSLLHDSEGNLWVGLNSTGIDIFPADGGPVVELRHDPSDPSSLSLNTVFTLFEDSAGDVWAGTYRGGLHRYVKETGNFVHYLHDPDDPRSIAGNDVRAIEEDENGNLWILTHGRGVSYFDREANAFRNYGREPDNPDDTLIDDWAHAIHYIGNGRLLVGTAVGLSLLDAETGEVRNFVTNPQDEDALSNSTINVIYEDSKSRIWIGTADGLNLFDRERGVFRSWSLEEGLPNRVVNSIIEDNAGLLWLGTQHGLARFDPETGRVNAYDAQDGLSSNAFYVRSAVKADDGTLYFGMMDGVTYFEPSEIRDNLSIPEVWITDFQVFNRSLKVDPDSEEEGVLKKSIMQTEKVVLSHESKMITLNFVALNFIQSAKNKYAYRLVGFDQEWNDAGTKREATYTNLNPGKYVFQVKASNNDGYWSAKPRELAIVITPPFWATIWFRSVSAALVIALPTFVVFWRLRSIKRQKIRLEATVVERTSDLSRTNKELEQAYEQLEKNQSQIQNQNRELIKHRENLESMVLQRTSELETAKEKAERSDRLKSAFLANMSHEIRTPMNAIIGLLDVLRIEDLSDKERESYTEVIKRSSSTLMTLIDDILDLSRIESGEATVQLQDCNCDEICEELFALFSHVASTESDGRIRMALSRNGVEGIGNKDTPDLIAPGFDYVRLKQILTNLLSNAIKFTDAGTVTLGYTTERFGEFVRIRFFVTDSGIGIPEEEISKVYERFHKVDARNGRVYRGTGLGLTISQRLAEMMYGRIECSSKLGEGTTFTVEFDRKLPATGDSDLATHLQNAQLDGEAKINYDGIFEGISLLVAEDEDPNFLVIERYLERTGATISRARNGEEALQLFDDGSFDLVLLDVKMPILDGFEVLGRIRRVDTKIPVIMQTAYAMESDQSKATALGASGFVSKPFTRNKLVGMVDGVLHKNQV